MAYCANCGHEISDLATACPQCGAPNTAAATGAGAPPMPYAGFWIRVAALILDGIILGIAGIFIRTGGAGGGGLVVGFLYNWLMIAFNDGRTLGKMACGIRIARPDGSPVDIGTAAARAGMAIVSGLALGLGYLWAAWDDENRTWHDMVANTRAFRVS